MAQRNMGPGASDAVPDPSIVPEPSSITEPWAVKKALSSLSLDPVEDSPSPVPYFHMLERLKLVKREGWRRFGINRGESIADHSYRMAMITMLAPPSLAAQLDMAKCMKMALIHDMAESLVGDLTPLDGVPKAEKNRRETLTVEYITTGLLGNVNGGVVGNDIAALFLEHEEGKTLESRFVSGIDKVELLLQMVEYEKRGHGKLDLTEFTYVATKLDLPEVKAWAREILEERERFWSGLKIAPREGPSAETKDYSDQYYGK